MDEWCEWINVCEWMNGCERMNGCIVYWFGVHKIDEVLSLHIQEFYHRSQKVAHTQDEQYTIFVWSSFNLELQINKALDSPHKNVCLGHKHGPYQSATNIHVSIWPYLHMNFENNNSWESKTLLLFDQQTYHTSSCPLRSIYVVCRPDSFSVGSCQLCTDLWQGKCSHCGLMGEKNNRFCYWLMKREINFLIGVIIPWILLLKKALQPSHDHTP